MLYHVVLQVVDETENVVLTALFNKPTQPFRPPLVLTDNDVVWDVAACALFGHEEAELARVVARAEECVLRTVHGGHHCPVVAGEELGTVVRVGVISARVQVASLVVCKKKITECKCMNLVFRSSATVRYLLILTRNTT